MMRSMLIIVAFVAGCGAKPSPFCGNNRTDPGEACDGTVPPGTTCESLGLGGGTLSCAMCELDTSGCEMQSVCGDGVANGVEECDGGDLKGQTCPNLGMLTCKDDCTLDDSGCTGSGNEITIRAYRGGQPLAGAVVERAPHGAAAFQYSGVTALDGSFKCAPFDPTDGTTVSVAAADGTTRHRRIYTGLTGGETIEVEFPPAASAPTTVGSGNFTFPGPLTGAVIARGANGCGSVQSSNLSSAQSLTFYSSCVDAANNGGIYIEAQNGTGDGVGWNFLSQVVSGATAFAFNTWNTNMDDVVPTVTNIPAGISDLDIRCSWGKDNVTFSPFGRLAINPPAGTPQTDTVKMPAGLPDRLACGATFDDTRRVTVVATPGGGTQTIDASHLMPTLSNVALTDKSEPGAFEVTWTETGSVPPLADTTALLHLRSNGNVLHVVYVYVPPGLEHLAPIPAVSSHPASAPFSLSGTTPVPSSSRLTILGTTRANGYTDYLSKTSAQLTGPQTLSESNALVQ